MPMEIDAFRIELSAEQDASSPIGHLQPDRAARACLCNVGRCRRFNRCRHRRKARVLARCACSPSLPREPNRLRPTNLPRAFQSRRNKLRSRTDAMPAAQAPRSGPARRRAASRQPGLAAPLLDLWAPRCSPERWCFLPRASHQGGGSINDCRGHGGWWSGGDVPGHQPFDFLATLRIERY
jgi:hypothetical protein